MGLLQRWHCDSPANLVLRYHFTPECLLGSPSAAGHPRMRGSSPSITIVLAPHRPASNCAHSSLTLTLHGRHHFPLPHLNVGETMTQKGQVTHSEAAQGCGTNHLNRRKRDRLRGAPGTSVYLYLELPRLGPDLGPGNGPSRPQRLGVGTAYPGFPRGKFFICIQLSS